MEVGVDMGLDLGWKWDRHGGGPGVEVGADMGLDIVVAWR